MGQTIEEAGRLHKPTLVSHCKGLDGRVVAVRGGLGGGGGVVGGVQVGSLGAIDYDHFARAADTDGRGLPVGQT